MSELIEFAVLTKSAKNHELCVAGIDWNTGQFIRLVSKDKETDGAIADGDFRYENKQVVECLDLIRVSVLNHDGKSTQPENRILDFNEQIEFVRRVSLKEVLKVHKEESDINIFGNTKPYVDSCTMLNIKKSLILVKVDNFKTYILNTDWEGRTKAKTKARFYYNDEEYTDISVTDPKYFNSTIVLDSVYLVISTGSKWHGKYYKWIAAIYEPSMLVQEEKYADMINPEGILESDGVNITTLVRNINYCLERDNKAKIVVKDLLDKLVLKGFLYKKGKQSRIDTKGFDFGIFYKDAVTKDGEPYRGIFYNKNMQALVLDFIDELTDEDKKRILNNK